MFFLFRAISFNHSAVIEVENSEARTPVTDYIVECGVLYTYIVVTYYECLFKRLS